MHIVLLFHPAKHNEKIFDDNKVEALTLLKCLAISVSIVPGILSLQCGLSHPLYNNPSPAFKVTGTFLPCLLFHSSHHQHIRQVFLSRLAIHE